MPKCKLNSSPKQIPLNSCSIIWAAAEKPEFFINAEEPGPIIKDLEPKGGKDKPSRSQENNQLGFPKFDGHDFHTWRRKCDQYSAVEETPEHLRLKCILRCLEGKALSMATTVYALQRFRNRNLEEFLT